jgi:hypothetical protein
MTIGSTSVGLGKTSGPKFFIYFSSVFVTSVAPTILSLLSPSDLPPTFAATTMGSCCGPCFTATRLCSSSHEVKMFLLVPSLSPCLLDPTAPTRPHRAQLPHPSTRTSSVMESCVLVVVKATSPPYYRCGRQISFMKKISLQICRGGGGGRTSPVCDSRQWLGSSAAAGPRLLGGGTSPEATVVGEVGRWRRRGRASGTSGRTTKQAAGR